MTFAWPGALLGLALLPLLLGAYVLRVRGLGVRGEAFAAPRMLASVLPRPPRWRRHLPMAATLLAAAALIVAAARPQRSVAVAVDRATVMLLTDVSGSMLARDVAPDRLTAARRAARAFVARVPRRVNVGVMAFNQAPTLLQSPTTDRAAAAGAIAGMQVSGGTATGDAVLAALRALERTPGARRGTPPAAIVLLSDGTSTRGAGPLGAARRAGDRRVPIYTVALGTDAGTIEVESRRGGTRSVRVPPDPATLSAMAEASGGESFAVTDAARLDQVYERLGSELGRATRRRPVTAWFAGAGLLMLLAAGGMSLRWFGRLA